jgi:hypothetical protein
LYRTGSAVSPVGPRIRPGRIVNEGELSPIKCPPPEPAQSTLAPEARTLAAVIVSNAIDHHKGLASTGKIRAKRRSMERAAARRLRRASARSAD